MAAKKGPAPDVISESATASPTERAFNILELVARTEATSIGEMISALGIPRPTVSRMVANLEASGYLRKAAGRGRYVIGPRLVNIAEDILRATAAQASSHVVLMELSQAAGESCSLGVMRGGEVIYLDSVASSAPLTLQFLAGQSAPLHCTSSDRSLQNWSNRFVRRDTRPTIPASSWESWESLSRCWERRIGPSPA
jgi:DNA-binding IclR family transcriptional regulator